MIGSREWMNISNGKLSFKQKTQLIKQVLLPATLSYSKTFTHKDSTTNSFKLTDIQIPDTAIVKEALSAPYNTVRCRSNISAFRTYFRQPYYDRR